MCQLTEGQRLLASEVRAHLATLLRKRALRYMADASEHLFESDAAACREAVEQAIASRDAEQQVLGQSDEQILQLPIRAA